MAWGQPTQNGGDLLRNSKLAIEALAQLQSPGCGVCLIGNGDDATCRYFRFVKLKAEVEN